MYKVVTRLRGERGVTLLEVLASIVILSIIVVTFLTFFIQSARTTNRSEGVLDSAFFAQTEMEEIYHYSSLYDYETTIEVLKADSEFYSEVDLQQQFTKHREDHRVDIIIEQSYNQNNLPITNLYTVIVSIYDQTDKKQAKIETKLLFEG